VNKRIAKIHTSGIAIVGMLHSYSRQCRTTGSTCLCCYLCDCHIIYHSLAAIVSGLLGSRQWLGYSVSECNKLFYSLTICCLMFTAQSASNRGSAG